jgi:hypothetical protein
MLGLRRQFRLVCLVVILTLFQGCALMLNRPQNGVSIDQPNPENCRVYFFSLDKKISSQGLNDAQYQKIESFPYLRLDRFSAALKLDIDLESVSFPALVDRLRALDREARMIELANAGMDLETHGEQVAQCATLLQATDLADPRRRRELSKKPVVDDDYSSVYRLFGAYALTKVPFAKGVERLEADRKLVLGGFSKLPSGVARRLLHPPSTNNWTIVDLAAMLKPDPVDPLQIPNPSPDQLAQLFHRFAPIFDIQVASDADQTGELQWIAEANAMKLGVNSLKPTVYQQTSLTRYKGHNLLQLNYTIWFAARPKERGAWIDLLAGSIDGLTVRVTLAPDGVPLMYDSIHPCGCYHTFFPPKAVRVKPSPEKMSEWAFAPINAPELAPEERLVIQVAAGTHYIDRLEKMASIDQTAERYQAVDYDQLRSLPVSPNVRRSAFDALGFMPGTERLESWVFWPMGIKRAGTMRQWGRHATAFVGRRHFDDADLMEQRFDFDPHHFPMGSK